MIYCVSNTKIDDKDVFNLAMLKITYLPIIVDFGDFDAVIITSKSSINALRKNQILPTDILVFALSDATYKAACDFGFKQIINSNCATWHEFSQFLKPKLAHKKVLYLRGEKVAGELADSLKNSTNLSELICYKNEPNELNSDIKIEENSIIIFGSALNFKSFYQKFGWHESWQAVSIGISTKNALKEHNIVSKTPQKPNLLECVKLAKSMQF